MKEIVSLMPPQVLRARLGRICVPIIGSSPNEMFDKAQIALKENPFLEFRLDYLANPLAALPRLKQFLYENSLATATATCRRTANGGRFKGTVAAELEVLEKAADAGCHLVDIELPTAQALKKPAMDDLRKKAAVILSYHDFEATGDLDAIFAKMRKFTPDFIKIFTTAKTLSDNVTMMHFLERAHDEADVIGACMGDAGIPSRVLGLRAGSVFTFAAATVGEETAPGQIAARTLRETYRIDQVDIATKVYGVAGDPIDHSLSPIMMNTAFRRETVNAVYLALKTAKIKDLLSVIKGVPLHGVSVTMPLKQEIIKHLDGTDALSAKIGACNTIVRAPDGRLFGRNTDAIGITAPLEQRLSLRDAHILVLGAGGAARAAVFALKDRGADVAILNRSVDKGQKLAREAKARNQRRDQLAKTNFDVIINATPVGMAGNKTQSLLTPQQVNAKFVFDMVYTPIDTPLLRVARLRGSQVITGVEMFVQQGAGQFEIWTAKPAPKEEMHRVVMHALLQRAAQQVKQPKAKK
jgi:3-dehydroquinate dehydratase/shikimate dehydrogenase